MQKNTTLNFGNSGTLARLLIGILSTTPNIELKLTGDSSLKRRSMKSIIQLMTRFGATFFPKGKFNFPLKIISSKMPIGIDYEAGVSAQLKSAVILAGLNAYGNTRISEKSFSRNHTENILMKNNKIIKNKENKKKNIEIIGGKNLNQLFLNIPGDPSCSIFYSFNINE